MDSEGNRLDNQSNLNIRESNDDDDISDAVTMVDAQTQPLPASHKLAMHLGVRAEDLQIKKASFFGAGDDDDDDDGMWLVLCFVLLYM